MRFPNLVWAIEEIRLRHYELADSVGMSAFRFSRCLRGRSDFDPIERRRIAAAFRYAEAWLFAGPTPPPKVNLLCVGASAGEPAHEAGSQPA